MVFSVVSGLLALPVPEKEKPKPETRCDAHGTPISYYDVFYGKRLTVFGHLRAFAGILLVAACVRGDTVILPLLLLHWLGYDFSWLVPQSTLAICALGVAFVVFSFVMAARLYYTHCKHIENWTAENQATASVWACQPELRLSEPVRKQAEILGTVNAGCAAVYGLLTPLFYYLGWSRLYVNVMDYGLVWFFCSWAVWFCWIELYAYALHRFFHLRFIYRHFHKLHHRFQPPTAFSGVAFHPFEFACYVLGGQSLLIVLPVHFSVVIAVGLYTIYYLIEDHTGIKRNPLWFWQPTTMYHDDHHRYFHVNFGQHVLWFDWLFGTLRDVRLRYDESTFGGKGEKKT